MNALHPVVVVSVLAGGTAEDGVGLPIASAVWPDNAAVAVGGTY